MVNTFLPYPSFRRSARVLDGARLNKQRLEVTWILKALNGAQGYARHPATRMWTGHDIALVSYGLAVHDELTRRKVPDNQNLEQLICDFVPFASPPDLRMNPVQLKNLGLLPWWFGWKAFHESHRSNLLRKNDVHYVIFEMDFDTKPTLPYVWPREKKGFYMLKHIGKEHKGVEYP